jgi:hypothetical protein
VGEWNYCIAGGDFAEDRHLAATAEAATRETVVNTPQVLIQKRFT